MALRPEKTTTNRFFINYQRGKCFSQPIGINKFRKNPQRIAEFLQLDQPECYTGHSLRRTFATVLVDAGADITMLKRHGGWKSRSVAEGYINESITNKNNTAIKIASAIGLSSVEPAINNTEDSEADANSTIQITPEKETSNMEHHEVDNSIFAVNIIPESNDRCEDSTTRIRIDTGSNRGFNLNLSNCHNFTINVKK